MSTFFKESRSCTRLCYAAWGNEPGDACGSLCSLPLTLRSRLGTIVGRVPPSLRHFGPFDGLGYTREAGCTRDRIKIGRVNSRPLQKHSSPAAHARDNRKKALPTSHRFNHPFAPSTVRVDSTFFSARKAVKSSKKPWSEKIQEVRMEEWKSRWRVMGTAGVEEARKRRRSTLPVDSQQEHRSRSLNLSPDPELSGIPLKTSILDSPSHKRSKTTDSKTDPLSLSITEPYNPCHSDPTPELSLPSTDHSSFSFPASSSADPNTTVAPTTAHLNSLLGHTALVVPAASSPTHWNSSSSPTTNDALPPKMKRKGATR